MTDDAVDAAAGTAAAPAKRRLAGIDAARGVALIGMISIHILPAWNPETFEPTAQWTVFAGRSAALFALLAGVSLAFSTGGHTPHTGRAMTADRAGILVRALLIAGLGLAINPVIPGITSEEVPAVNILVYYGAFFLLVIPFLRRSVTALIAWAGLFALAAPVLTHLTRDALPVFTDLNPGFADLAAQPAAAAAHLLLTGTYPALPYLAYLLAGLAIGRLDLADLQTQAALLSSGMIMAVTAWFVYWVLILQAGGYDQLMNHTPALTEDGIDDIIIWGPDPILPTTTWWWLAIAGPHTNTPLALAMCLGSGTAVLGLFLLLGRTLEKWLLPLAAMGSMTLTLYSTHLLALSTEVHYDQPYLWFIIQVVVAALFATAWQRALGQGPLERVVGSSVKLTRRAILGGHPKA
ncbi:heparan-alpha-glucosaminide N-acetyltransferase domain-containing protein [Kocuria sp. WN036]|uniref:heparan-alpha-glucosaminide N-acetyltransferase domain-containing protein n=1 Tax=Kocuria sp. WN036 TaxID=2032628 RepID=UPI0020D018F7|nr:heparan-alpha-glucosaminide N-acetyltransferase domain-containing protein [Kocuria sp. WN036]